MNEFKVHTTKFNIGLPTEHAIEIYQRKSFKETYQAVDGNGEPVDLSPYTIAMQIRGGRNTGGLSGDHRKKNRYQKMITINTTLKKQYPKI